MARAATSDPGTMEALLEAARALLAESKAGAIDLAAERARRQA